MSSKFAKSAPTQRTPSICRKPPPGAEYQPPPFFDSPYDGYVDYLQPASPMEGQVMGTLQLTPGPLSNEWHGELLCSYYSITIHMTFNSFTMLLSYTMRIFSGPLELDVRTVLNTTPRSFIPFDSGEISADPPPPGGHARWHFWS